MSRKYELVLGTGESREFARKDSAIAAGEKSGVTPYWVHSPSGQVVHEVEKSSGETKVSYSQGAKVFWPEMGPAAENLAVKNGFGAEINPDFTVTVSGGTEETREQVISIIGEMWESAYEKFKEWKRKNRDSRKKLYETSDGRREMLTQELKALRKFCKESS